MKKTDIEVLRDVFTSLKVPYEVVNDRILLGEGEGYTDFWCAFDFTGDGKFLSHSVCEG